MKKTLSKYFHNIIQLKYLAHTMSFVIPFAIILGICMGIGVYPFGDQSLLHMDAYHQYGPFFMDFARNIKEGKSLMYTWNLGLGSDYVSLYAYYLASPLNWLLFFIPVKYVIEFMDLTIVLKMALCGFTFFLYLKDHFHLVGKDNRLHQRTVLPALACSTAYALCGFVAAYSWDIMWMDSVALAPLIFLGIDKLMKENKVALYYISLAVAIFSNYYISIMICIFAVFYFAAMFLELKKGHLKAIGRFALYSILAGGTSAVLILPEIAILGASGSSTNGFPEKMEWYFDFFSTVARGCMVATPHKGNDHWPNIYAGCFVFLMVFLYAMNRRISLKKKLTRLGMVAFFLVSFSNNYLDFLWHGFHFPQALPGRQSFLFAFLLLCMTFEVCRYFKDIRWWQVLVAFSGCIALLTAGYLKSDLQVTEEYAFWATGGFILCYAVLMLMMKVVRNRGRIFLCRFTFVIVLVELTVNMAVTGLCSSNRQIYLNKMQPYQILLMEAEKDAKEDAKEAGYGDVFYRVEDTERKTKNDDSLYGYASATIFSSLMNLEVSHLFQAVYMEGGLNYYCYNGATPLTSGMLTVKYLLSDSPHEESKLRTLIGQFNGQYLYENNYYLPLGFMMTEEQIEAFNIEDKLGKIAQMNLLSSALAGGNMIYNAMSWVEIDSQNGKTEIQIERDGYYYVAHQGCNASNLSIYNDRTGYSKTFGKTTHTYLLELGECKAKDRVLITNSGGETVNFSVYYLDMDVVDRAYETLSQQTMILDEKGDTYIKGHIDVTEEGRLIFSIPADEGWTLWVDGERTEIEAFKKALVSVHLEEGTHTIELSYMTPNLIRGAQISIGCVAAFVILMIVRKIICIKRKNRCQENS